MILYSALISANSYKVRLTLAWLRRACRLVEVDVLAGENRTATFMALNPTGQVPVLVLPGGQILPESGAILCFLAENTALMPADAFERAEVLRWMFFEQHMHEPSIGAARFWLHHMRGGRELKQNLVEEWEDRGYQTLAIMDGELGRRPFIAGAAPTIADIALYANTHLAHEGGFDLSTFPAVRDWLRRMEAQPGHVAIDDQSFAQTHEKMPAGL